VDRTGGRANEPGAEAPLGGRQDARNR
jgi:hypothetical protein